MDKNSNTATDKLETKEFVPPRHWIGPEELNESYWADAKIKEKRGQEFFEKPLEYLENLDQTGQTGMARRSFLTVMGASMAMASFACARRPVHKIIPYVVKPEEITPGVANWYASTCSDCSTSCGILVKNREGRPIKIEGNPDHPMNRGTLCARGQASVLGLYDPDRLKAPLIRSRENGTKKETDWAAVDLEIQSKLKVIAAKEGRVRVLSGEIQGDTTRKLVQEFLGGFKQGALVEFDPLAMEEIAAAQADSYGSAVIPRYRFDQADVVVSLGADFLGTWLSPVEHSMAWSKGRKLAGEKPAQAKLSKLYCFESMMTLTGANADERFPIRPGDELKIALALAHELLVEQKKLGYASNPSIMSALQSYRPTVIATEIGMEDFPTRIKNIANSLWNAKGKSLVVGGGVQTKTKDSKALQIAVNLLNSVLENEGSTVDGTAEYSTSTSSFAAFLKLIGDMKAGQVDALIIYRTNPFYTLPKNSLGLSDAFKKVPLIILVSDREDETGLITDYVLPDHHPLESWGDANPRKGLYSLQQPAMAPIHSTRAFQDTLLIWGKNKDVGLKIDGSLAARSLDWHDYLKNRWKETLYKESGAVANFDRFWESILRAGVYQVSANRDPKRVSPRRLNLASLNQLPRYAAMDSSQTRLVLYPTVAIYDGKNANNAWLQEMPDPISTVTWDNYLNVGPALAQKLGVKENDVVEVSSGDVSAQFPVHVQPGLHSDVVAAAVGYGRRSVGKVGNLAGVDVYPFVQVGGNELLFAGQPVKIKKTGKFYFLAATQWHGATQDRPVINDITLAEFRKNPAASMHTNPELRLEEIPTIFKPHEYKGYRWGMGIDLNSCTGCGACVIACQAENNVPVVGRDQVRVSRQMHWIRIDRYFSGSPANPDVVFQPMLCQHCENASCESVCPVVATIHDDEGLNVQVYNRCVGTRYCQNNCPYKVRRFNYFDHWKAYEGPMNMVWNPDVTVRTRGIMEKCSFCTQRIMAARDKAKDLGDHIKDGDVQTACQQTCPTQAIVFGDMNDPASRVSKMKESPQAFRVLEVLNNKPSISYMTKVRNKEGSAHAAGGEHA
jgi:molybdopterin-containing oxidoreductase family iron-sulfur binding subunit